MRLCARAKICLERVVLNEVEWRVLVIEHKELSTHYQG
jgi:hypothetical protein